MAPGGVQLGQLRQERPSGYRSSRHRGEPLQVVERCLASNGIVVERPVDFGHDVFLGTVRVLLRNREHQAIGLGLIFKVRYRLLLAGPQFTGRRTGAPHPAPMRLLVPSFRLGI